MKHLLILTLIGLTFVSCSRNRGTEKAREPVTRDWQRKVDYLGSSSDVRDAYYSKVTVVKNTIDGGFIFAGYQSDMRVGYFDFTEHELQFKSLQGEYRGRETSLTASPLLYAWPITHHQLELQEVDGKTINKEIDDDRKKWYEKSQFKVDFALPKITEENALFSGGSVGECWKEAGRRRVDNSLQVEPGYISFVIEVIYSRQCPGPDNSINGHTNYAVQYRYSFRRVEKTDYEPMVYDGEQDPRMRKFGYFQSIKSNLVNGERRNLFFVNRWHPNKTHYFYFTKGFPQKYKFIYKDIFEKTNAVFIQKGLPVRFKVEENDFDPSLNKRTGVAKEFGDLRYSFINLVEELDPSAPLGYGPSDADPFTGEIIAANLNVWSGMVVNYLRRLEQSYFRNATEEDLKSKLKWDNSTLYSEMKKLLEEEDHNNWSTQWTSPTLEKVYDNMLLHTVYTYPGWNMFTASNPQTPVAVIADHPTSGGFKEDRLLNTTVGQLSQHKNTISGFKGVDALQDLDSALTQPLVQTVSKGLIDYSPLEDSILNQKLPKELQKMDLDALKSFSQEMENYEKHELRSVSENYRGHCKLSMEASLAGVERFYIYGFNTDEIAYNIIYRTSIHEFGHNLNLRHNFYGTLDKKNFLPPSVPKFEAVFEKNDDGTFKLKNNHPVIKELMPVIDPATGKQEMWPTVSSSVMEYLRLQDEFFTTLDWELYDIAALAYAYSGGRIDESLKKNYLYCSDEHTITSAVCNRFDRGSTPSEIMMSLIDTYEDGYYTRNYRFDRQYWDTSGYMRGLITLMKEMKEFLPMWRGAFYSTNIQEVLAKKGITKNKVETDEIVTLMDREMKQANRLAMAFYQSVLLQKDTDKPYRSVYELGTGALQRMGIANDKMVAMYFLAGDDQIYYNPNRVILYSSYMTYMNEPEFAKIMDKIMENIVTQRVDMEPWFISFGRQLYAQSSMNFSNRENESFINKIKIKRYTIEELGDYFNYKFENDNDKVANLVTLETSQDFDFKKGEEVAVVGVNSKYYMFSKQGSRYAYDIYKGIKQNEEFENPTVEGKLDLQELYYIYTIMSGGTL